MIQLLYCPQKMMLTSAVNKLLKNKEDVTLEKFDLSEMTLDSLANELENVSLLIEKRYFVVSDCGFLLKEKGIRYLKGEVKQGEAFYQYLENPLEDVDLFLLACVEDLPKGGRFLEALKKGGAKINPVKVFSYNEWLSFIPSYLKKRGVEIEVNAIEPFYDRIQGDYGLFINEASKLISYSNGKTITKEDIDQLVSAPPDENAFHLYEAIISKDAATAYKVYRDLKLTSNNEVVMLHLIGSQLRFLSQCLSLAEKGYDNGMIASELKTSKARVGFTLMKAKRCGLDRLKELIELTYQTDLNILRGKVEASIAFNTYLAKATR